MSASPRTPPHVHPTMQTLPSSSSPSPPPSSNRNPKTNQALQFIRLISPLLRPSTSSSSTSTSTSLHRRRRLVRRAAYASMAMAVRPRMTWSRSILRRLRRSRPPVPSRPNAPLPPTLELRRLVPGGKAMDLCTLLEETGHYIQCLSLQVKIMRSILDSSSPAKDKDGLF